MSASSSLLGGRTTHHSPSPAPSSAPDELDGDEPVYHLRAAQLRGASIGQQSSAYSVWLTRLQVAGAVSWAALGVVLAATLLLLLASGGMRAQLLSSLVYSATPLLASPLSASSVLSSARPAPPMLSRGVFLFLCATQAEANHYLVALPPVIADVLVYCWKERCTLDGVHSARAAANLSAYGATPLYVSPWTSTPDAPLTMRNGRRRGSPFRRHTDVLVVAESEAASGSRHGGASGGLSEYAVPSAYEVPGGVLDEYYRVAPSVQVWSEAEVQPAGTRSSWTSARNFLLAQARQREAQLGWRYAYLTFGDGDVTLLCPRFHSVVRTGQPLQAVNGTRAEPGRLDLYLPQFLHWWHTTRRSNPPAAYPPGGDSEAVCWLGYFASLLTAAPAQGTFQDVYSRRYGQPHPVDGEVAWNWDAILSSFHADAVELLLPYCQRWDAQSWYVSQVAVVARGVCTLGHALYFNHILVDPARFTHQPYAKNVDPWDALDAAQADTHTAPRALLGVQRLLQRNSSVGEISMAEYGGWHSGLVSAECQTRQADPVSCVWLPRRQPL